MSSLPTSGPAWSMVRVFPLDKLRLTAPYFESVAAGFPSPADDYTEEKLDVSAYLVRNPTATFFVRVNGDSMIEAGIHHDDILIVDRSIPAQHNSIVIAALNGACTVKRLYRRGGTIELLPANRRHAPIAVTEGDDLIIWGVVIHVLHRPV